MNDEFEMRGMFKMCKPLKMGFWRVFKDMINLVGFSRIICKILMSTIIVMVLFFCEFEKICEVNKIQELILDVFVVLLESTIAGFAIILGLQMTSILRLKQKADDNKRPLFVISATFSIALLFQICTIATAIAYGLLLNQLVYYIMLCFTIVSILMLMSLVFHLFCLTTFIDK